MLRFDFSIICVVVFINYFIQFINVHSFQYSIHMLVIFILHSSDKSCSNNHDFIDLLVQNCLKCIDVCNTFFVFQWNNSSIFMQLWSFMVVNLWNSLANSLSSEIAIPVWASISSLLIKNFVDHWYQSSFISIILWIASNFECLIT